MSFHINEERKKYIEANGRVVLNACPGSGKTTTIAHKLLKLAEGWSDGNPKGTGIACLSFTNVAKNEIAEKFKTVSGFPLTYPHSISTIDSFINNNISLPFGHNILKSDKRLRIVDDMSFIDKMFLNNFSFIKQYKQLLYRFSPSKIDYNMTGGISWDGHDKSADADFVSYGKAVKTAQFKAGLLKTSDSALLAWRVLQKIPRISRYLSLRFSYLIVDEAQDTSEIQHAIFDELFKGGLENLDLVGDPYQGLYQWRDASPGLFYLKYNDTANWKGLRLSENRRSTQKIVDVFSSLRMEGEPLIRSTNNSDKDLPLHILKYLPGKEADVIQLYEKLCADHSLTNNRILVRGNTLKNTLLGRNTSFEPWSTEIPYKLIDAKIHMDSNEIKDAVRLLKRVCISLFNDKMEFHDLKDFEENSNADHQFQALLFNLIRDLPDMGLAIKQWTVQTQEYLKEKLGLGACPNFGIRKKSSEKFNTESLLQPVNLYFKRAISDSNLPITTIHQAKGMTFESVLLVLSETSTGQNISLKDMEISKGMPSEKQRLIYVGISRPQKLLCLGLPVSCSNKILISRFGKEVVIV